MSKTLKIVVLIIISIMPLFFVKQEVSAKSNYPTVRYWKIINGRKVYINQNTSKQSTKKVVPTLRKQSSRPVITSSSMVPQNQEQIKQLICEYFKNNCSQTLLPAFSFLYGIFNAVERWILSNILNKST